ncbi:MAG: M48 family metalloprotease [Desulfobacula sp.]|jgi:predicted Zn-dependent protease
MKLSRILNFFLVFFLIISFSSNTCFAISIPDEKELGKKFIEMIERKQMLLHDPIASHMVDVVGRHIISYLPSQPFDFSFYVVNDDIFNAFAAPGSNVFAYRGLITSLDSIDELAGIIGHEIAHAASRHVSESIDRSKYISIGSLAGVLAGILVGSKSGGNAAGTLVKGSLALGQTAMLAFTRENETEADEKGIMFLKESCYSPKGLLSGLLKIRESDYRGVENIPDYVKTHPGTGSRIAHVENILSGYTPAKKPACIEDLRFEMVKYRLMGLYGEIEPSHTKLTRLLEKDPGNAAIHYGLGLIYDRKFRRPEALEHLKKALAINVFDPMVLLELGRIYQENGEAEKALEILKAVEPDPVLGVMARFYEAAAHLELKNIKQSEMLFNLVIEKAPKAYPTAYYNLANIMSLQNRLDLSHYYLGLFYLESGNAKTAMVHLNKALESLSDTEKFNHAKVILEKLEKEDREEREEREKNSRKPRL